MDQLIPSAVSAASTLPGWFLAGTPVSSADLLAVNEDTADILEPEEFDWHWFLADVPLSLIHFDPVCGDLPDLGRMSSLASLPIDKRPPVILEYQPGSRMRLLDGYHRCTLATREGAKNIQALVGVGPARNS